MCYKKLQHTFSLVIGFCLSLSLRSQPTGYSDPAQQYNRITRDKFASSYTLIGGYKVTGNPYLYGGGNEGTLYLKGEGMKKGKLSYNTFSQQVEITETEGSKPEIRDFNSVDSFFIEVSSEFYKGELQFVNGNQWDAKNKFFAQKVFTAAPYNLYKRFYSMLEVVTTNYVQSELRQFELNYDYYYTNTANSGLNKLKTNENGIRKEFASKKDCIAGFDFETLGSDKENVLKSFFQSLSACK